MQYISNGNDDMDKIAVLHSLENSPEILSFAINDVPIWGGMLRGLTLELASVKVFDSLKNTVIPPTIHGIKTKVRKVFLSAANVYRAIGSCFLQNYNYQFTMAMLPSGDAYYKMFQNRVYDPITSPFGELLRGKCIYLERHLSPPNLLASDGIPTMNVALIEHSSAISIALQSKRIKKLAESLLDFIKSKFHTLNLYLDDNEIDMLRSQIRRQIASISMERALYRKLFKFISPKIIGCTYACVLPSIVAAAHDLSIKVCEPQHGMVYRGHLGYNYPPVLRESILFNYCQPDFFFLYGLYWKESIAIPGKTEVIGNPYFTIREPHQKNTHSGGCILFALTIYLDVWVDVIKTVSKAFPGQVIVRVHPSMRNRVSQADILCLDAALDTNIDLYDTLNKCDVVVGDISTSLYEAACMGKRVFIDANAYCASMTPFAQFRDGEEVVSLIQDSSSGYISQRLQEEIFAPDWENNFSKFLEREVECGN